jgi:hypothetical protein
VEPLWKRLLLVAMRRVGKSSIFLGIVDVRRLEYRNWQSGPHLLNIALSGVSMEEFETVFGSLTTLSEIDAFLELQTPESKSALFRVKDHMCFLLVVAQLIDSIFWKI